MSSNTRLRKKSNPQRIERGLVETFFHQRISQVTSTRVFDPRDRQREDPVLHAHCPQVTINQRSSIVLLFK